MSKRKLKSIFNLLCEFINTIPVGSTYTSKQSRDHVATRAKELDFNPLTRQRSGHVHSNQKGLSYPVGSNHVRLLTTRCIKRVKRGVYEVVGHIPDFVTISTTDANCGYTKYVKNPDFDPSKPQDFSTNYPKKSVPRGKRWKLGEPYPEASIKVKKEQPKKKYSDELLEELVDEIEMMKGFKDIKDDRNGDKILCVDHPKMDVVIIFYVFNNKLRFTYMWGQEDVFRYNRVSELIANEIQKPYQYDGIEALTVKEYIGDVFRFVQDIEHEKEEKEVFKVKSKLLVIGKVEGMLKQVNAQQAVAAKLKSTNDGVVILGITNDPNFVRIKFTSGIIHNVSIDDLVNIEYISIEASNKEKIVAILKEGLSANDAADKIIKLF